MAGALHLLVLICGYLICALLGILGILVLREIYNGKIDLSLLISEPNGDASMSRFQFLVFTFVIALSLFLIVAALVESGTPGFPVVPGTILTLLGISGSSYLVSKGIQFSDPAGITGVRGQDIVISPGKATVGFGQKQQFTAEVSKKPGAKVKFLVIAGAGAIDENTGIYTAPAAAQPNLPAGTGSHATIQVSTDEFPDAYDLAVITLV
jgi:hypothetical protein